MVFFLVFLIAFLIIVVTIKRGEDQIITRGLFWGASDNYIMIGGAHARISASMMAAKPINVSNVAENTNFLLPVLDVSVISIRNMGFDRNAETHLSDNKRFAPANFVSTFPLVRFWRRNFVLTDDNYASVSLGYEGRSAAGICYFQK